MQTYDYVNNTLEPSRKLYPITVRGQLVLWATNYNGQYQLTSGLVEEVRSMITKDTPFALIYDSDSAYIYKDNALTMISEFPYAVNTRSKIFSSINMAEHEISLAALGEGVSIGYSGLSRSLSANQWCWVTYVPQVYSNICWAATVACIYNYNNDLTGSSALNAETVARSIKGTNFNRSIEWEHIAGILDEYDIDYRGARVYDLDALNAADIHGSIMNDYPVFAWFDVIGSDQHAVTIYGSNVIAGRMVVMDPNSGSNTATINSSGDYTYVSSVTNATLVLVGAFYEPGE